MLTKLRLWILCSAMVGASAAAAIRLLSAQDDLAVALTADQQPAMSIAALERLQMSNIPRMRAACEQIIKSSEYNDDLRTWCLQTLRNSYGPEIGDIAALCATSWFEPEWINPKRASMTNVSMQTEFSDDLRSAITVTLECPFARRAGRGVYLRVFGVTRRELTECVQAIQGGRPSMQTCRIAEAFDVVPLAPRRGNR